MRPRSIVIFERLYLGSALLSLLLTPWTFAQSEAVFQANPALAQFESFGRIMMIVSIIVGITMSLVLWYFIARRASNVAKWIFVAITAYSLLSAINLYVSPVMGVRPPATLALASGYVLHLAAMYFLFRKDAVAWLEGTAPIDPDVFN